MRGNGSVENARHYQVLIKFSKVTYLSWDQPRAALAWVFPYCGVGWKGQRNQASPPHWCPQTAGYCRGESGGCIAPQLAARHASPRRPVKPDGGTLRDASPSLESPINVNKPYFQRCWEQVNTCVMEDKTAKCEGKYARAEVLLEVRTKLHNFLATLEKETWLLLEMSPWTVNPWNYSNNTLLHLSPFSTPDHSSFWYYRVRKGHGECSAASPKVLSGE